MASQATGISVLSALRVWCERDERSATSHKKTATEIKLWKTKNTRSGCHQFRWFWDPRVRRFGHDHVATNVDAMRLQAHAASAVGPNPGRADAVAYLPGRPFQVAEADSRSLLSQFNGCSITGVA